MSNRIVVEEEEPPEDVEAAPFKPRDVEIRSDKWVTEDYEIFELLGRGRFGEVKRCREKTTGQEFAAKFICTPRAEDKTEVRHEVNMMKKLQHKRLIQLYEAVSCKDEMCLIVEIIYGGELFDRVIGDDFVLTEKACICFMKQICEGLDYMHSTCNIIHLDMKPENILCLTRTGNRIKIIDFGLAREYDSSQDLRVLFGTPEFMAPEVVNYDPIDFSTDMWSLGVISYVLLSGLSPFQGDNDGETLTNVIKAQYDFDYAEFDEISEDAQDFISNLLVKDKKKRLSSKQCLEHPWLNKSNSTSQSVQLSTKRLKRFVYRRKWQKAVHAIIALKRMGVPLYDLKRRSLTNVRVNDSVVSWDTSAQSSSSKRKSVKSRPGNKKECYVKLDSQTKHHPEQSFPDENGKLSETLNYPDVDGCSQNLAKSLVIDEASNASAPGSPKTKESKNNGTKSKKSKSGKDSKSSSKTEKESKKRKDKEAKKDSKKEERYFFKKHSKSKEDKISKEEKKEKKEKKEKESKLKKKKNPAAETVNEKSPNGLGFRAS